MISTTTWLRSPAVVQADDWQTTLTNTAGESVTITRAGLIVDTRQTQLDVPWPQVTFLEIRLPLAPRGLGWLAALMRQGGPGTNEAYRYLQISGFKGYERFSIDYGNPVRRWDRSSQRFWLALKEYLPSIDVLSQPNLEAAYNQYTRKPTWQQILSRDKLVRDLMTPAV